ncbi:hypothetical protein [Lysobacter enzymogenes]|uniref:hypothetical protein n=1 Tax=Lysobacter enzymogenes TaxID=69 RepID=UPI001304184B|nr:hypothetical protein [Lysobacter enzymogenes]UZW61928.1 hypothetical protein BV903_006395 [Lysobacter enzymogenes]
MLHGVLIAIKLAEKTSRNPLIRNTAETHPLVGSPQEGRKQRKLGEIFAKPGAMDV